jgi:tetratricopeptide (TPR) repeat protein
MLYFQDKNFSESSKAFNQAIILEPIYYNARYFLGLSLYEIGEEDGAKEQFEFIAQDHPDNREIKLILENLENNREPLFKTEPPLEERTELPLEE